MLRARWNDDHYISFTLGDETFVNTSNHGHARLLKLYALCNAMKMQLHIGGVANGHLRISFHREDIPLRFSIHDWYSTWDELRDSALEHFADLGGTIEDMRINAVQQTSDAPR